MNGVTPDNNDQRSDAVGMLQRQLRALAPTFAPTRSWDTDPAVAVDAVTRFLVLGDTTGSPAVVEAAAAAAQRHNCQAVVQVGDFWLEDGAAGEAWPPRPGCGAASQAAADSAVPVVVVDGNHEAWPCLQRVTRLNTARTAAAAGLPVHLTGSLWWARRGNVWTWAGRRIGALGGAVSPDAWMAHLAYARWPRVEAPTRKDLTKLVANAGGGLDVLLSHDAPTEAWWLVSGLEYEMPGKLAAAASDVRALISEAADTLKPALAVHGHWDSAGQGRLDSGVEVLSLADAPNPGSCGVVDLVGLSMRTVPLHKSRRR